MKIKHLILSALAVASIAVSCKKDNEQNDKPSLTLNPSELAFEVAGGTQTVSVEANREWSISDPDKIVSWLTVEKKSDTEVEVTAAKNDGTDRTAEVTIRMVGVKKSISISQKGEGGAVEEGDGSKEKPYTAAQALAVTSALEKDAYSDKEYYVKGIVCNVKEISTEFGNATFWISDDGNDVKETRFYVFRAKGANGASITDENIVKVGDAVVVYGKFQNYYGNTPQLSNGGQIVSVNGGGDNPDTPVVEETTATGVVVAINTKGFLVKTDTGIQYVFDASITPEVAVGDNVTVKGVQTVYNGTPEITSYTVTVNSKGNAVTYPEPTVITADNMASYETLFGYVKTTGTLTITSKGYHNLEVTGAPKTVSLAYAAGVDASFNGKNIDVVGYYVGLTGSNGAYFNIVITGVSLSDVQPEPEAPEDGSISLTISDIASNFTATEVDSKPGFTGTVDGVTITYWNEGGNTNNPIAPSADLRLYKSCAMTIAVDGKKIKKVEFTLGSKKDDLTIDSDGGKVVSPSGTTITWEGTATSEFKCTAAVNQVRFTKIVIVAE